VKRGWLDIYHCSVHDRYVVGLRSIHGDANILGRRCCLKSVLLTCWPLKKKRLQTLGLEIVRIVNELP
jgi:hypothetical protein